MAEPTIPILDLGPNLRRDADSRGHDDGKYWAWFRDTNAKAAA